MDKGKITDEGKLQITEDEATKLLRTSFLAARGIDVQIQEIADEANQKIAMLEREKEEYINQNQKATEILKYYKEMEKEEKDEQKS